MNAILAIIFIVLFIVTFTHVSFLFVTWQVEHPERDIVSYTACYHYRIFILAENATLWC